MTVSKKSYSEAKGFIHERIIYEYMKDRVAYGNLRIRSIIKSGRLTSKMEFVTVTEVETSNTLFPDISKLVITDFYSKKTEKRVAEVKFLTSDFNYHKDSRFNEFMQNNGCIIVLKHDKLPARLNNIDIYELERADFESYVRENFERLLSQQLLSRDHDDYKIWIFSQTKNFYQNKNNSITSPACQSGIWCPTETMTSFDLAKKDKVVFIKFGGEFQLKQKVNSYLKDGNIFPNWFINQLWIGEITLPIKERKEYCQLKKYDINYPLWHSECTSKKFWPRVFCFKKVNVINCKIPCKELYSEFQTLISPILYEVFFQQVAREISHTEYIKLIEYIASKYSVQVSIKNNNKIDIKTILDDIITSPGIFQEVRNHLNTIENSILH